MRIFNLLFVFAMSSILSACNGGGSDENTDGIGKQTTKDSESAKIQFVVNYLPNGSPISNLPPAPAPPASATAPPASIDVSIVLVSPISGKMKIGVNEIAKVEFLLFGSDKQELNRPNSQPKDNPQERYAFNVPPNFISGIYVCGQGTHLSEVRITDVTGSTLSKTFELCPGIPFETQASTPG